MNVRVYTLNAFAKTETGGNPAGVVLDADGLSEKQMRSIAATVGFSETAFVQKSEKADFKVRFFTPEKEVGLCGHATIGTFYLLAHTKRITPGKYTQETNAGILSVEARSDRTIFMNQVAPQFFENMDPEKIAESLHIPKQSLMPNLPCQIVSTGIKDIIIPVVSLKELFRIKPDFDRITKISKRYDVVSYHVFTLETKFHGTAHCRDFAPAYGIPEESATGTANGALSCYLFKHGLVTEAQSKDLIFEQGYCMHKPSEIKASLVIKNAKIIEVKIGGVAAGIQERIVVVKYNAGRK